MVSGGWNNRGAGKSTFNTGNGGLDKTVHAVNKGGKIVGKGIKGGVKKGLSNLATGMAGAKVAVVKIVLIGGAIFAGAGTVSTIVYYQVDEEDGKSLSYVDNDNTVDAGEESEVGGDVSLSDSNSACLSYYTLLSEEKSIWQEYTDKDGETTLISSSDENAVKDYFENDKNFYVNANLLYAMNKILYTDDFVYPEAFLKPVAYSIDDNGDYHLTSLVNDKGKVTVKSDLYTSKGEKKDKTKKMVSDYGIASVLVYKEEKKTTDLKGTYIQEDYYDTSTCTVKQKTINESFSINLSSSTENVITHAVTISGAVNFTYEPDETMTDAVQSGETTDETQNVKKVLYKTIKVVTYRAKNGSIQKSFSSKIAMENYCNAHKEFSPIKDKKGEYRTYTRSYDLYKYRSDDSGIYINFVKKTDSTTTEEDTSYLYDYMKNFCTYKPVIDRTNDVFLSISSGASVSNLKNASATSGETTLGSGANAFEMFYNGSKKEVIERIWDICITWGYTEEQTSAILGNITQESSFETTVNDKDGAYGLCQFMNGRLTGLKKFASEYKKTEPSDLDTQIQYMLLELQGGDGTYAGDGWSHTSDRQADYENFFASNDIEVLTRAMCHGFERPDDSVAMYQKRISCAYSAYKLLHGRTVETGSEVLLTDLLDGSDSEGSSSTVTSKLKYSSGSMSEKDRKAFNEFYHAVDDIYSGDLKIELYSNPLTTDDANLVIKTANAFINQTTLSQAQLTIDNQMWSKGYISSIADMQAKVESDTSDSDSDLIVGDGEYILPVVGKHTITSDYGYRNSPTAGASSNHKGVDIGATYGEGIYCAKDGVVTFAGWGGSGGNYIMVEHENGVVTMYLHNSKLLVKVGQKVKQGQKIALAGSTGISTGTHCHISVMVNGVYQDPHNYFDFSKLSEE